MKIKRVFNSLLPPGTKSNKAVRTQQALNKLTYISKNQVVSSVSLHTQQWRKVKKSKTHIESNFYKVHSCPRFHSSFK